MARTPLMSRLLHLVGDVHEAQDRGVPIALVRAERRSGVSRRDFLKGAGATALGLSVAGPAGLLRDHLGLTQNHRK